MHLHQFSVTSVNVPACGFEFLTKIFIAYPALITGCAG